MRRTVVSAQAHASGKDQFSVREQSMHLYHGAVFEAKGNFRLAAFRSRSRDSFLCLLWLNGAVPVDPATSKEAVMYHAMAKQKKADYQDGYKQEPSDSKPARL
jgi:hypothetical protein